MNYSTLTRNIAFYIWILLQMGCSNCDKEIKYKYYNDGFILKKYEVCNGKRNGTSIGYYKNGQMAGTGSFKDDKFNGLWTYYYKSGKIKSKQLFENGKLLTLDIWNQKGEHVIVDGNGISTIYCPNGKPMFKVSYKNNELHGENITWDENGKIESIIYYNEGEPCGVWSFYKEDGTLLRVEDSGIKCE